MRRVAAIASEHARAALERVGVFPLVFVGIQTVLRALLLVSAAGEIRELPKEVARIYVVGVTFDLVVASVIVAVSTAYSACIPSTLARTRGHRAVMHTAFVAAVFAAIVAAIAEWLFWEEFGARLNFIAVDYLVYTREVWGNAYESYPVEGLLSAAAAAALGLWWMLRDLIDPRDPSPTWHARIATAAASVVIATVGLLTVPGGLADRGDQRVADELARNGIYSLVAAFRQNEVDYERFYPVVPTDEADARVRAAIRTPDEASPASLSRFVDSTRPERSSNVVLIVVESLSAKFLGSFGGETGLTPRLDALARDGLAFSQLYATGTRTVRGLEAITLSVPPTPGRSIIKRQNNTGMFTIGTVFRDAGYTTTFYYGGYGYFDNMNAFFAGNGFQVVDRADLPADGVQFSNVWGVSDEDLLDRVLVDAGRQAATGQPFFSLVLTTSNHRPYTYPAGRVPIPPGTGRSGAVQYTDYAIGRFIDAARREPWFDDTVFVVIADHCASSAGRARIPVDRYRIPMIVYAPGFVAPRSVDTLASQIDVAPTLLGLLGFRYQSAFFGQDILRVPAARGRALLGTYQQLGYLRDGVLTVLGPGEPAQQYDVAANGEVSTQPRARERWRKEDAADAISYYQTAARAWHAPRYRELALRPLAARGNGSE